MKKRIVSLAFALTLLLGGVGRYSLAAVPDLAASPCVTGRSLTLKGEDGTGDIGLNLYLKMPETWDLSDVYGVFNGTSVRLAEKEKEPDGSYKLTASVAAKEMDKAVILQVFKGNSVQPMVIFSGGVPVGATGTYAYSVNEYIKAVKSDAALVQRSPNLVRLMEAMSTYGDYAKKFFLTPDMIAADLGAAGEEAARRLAALPAPAGTGSVSGLTYVGSSLLLESATTLRHYFTLAGEAGEYAFTLEGQPLAPAAKNGGYYYVEITDIAAKDLDDVKEVTVTKGEENYTIAYSVLHYCQKTLANSEDGILKDLVKAICLYHEAAAAYFDSAV